MKMATELGLKSDVPVTLHSFLAFIAPLLLMAATGCQTPKPDSTPLAWAEYSGGSDVEGKMFSSIIHGKALLAAPTWPASQDWPPLSPGKAKRAAIGMITQTVGDVQHWRLKTIRLVRPFDNPCGGDYWAYELWFRGPSYKSPDGTDRTSQLHIYVLMNGEVIPLQPNDSHGK
jgi:hypothetical protein